MDLRHVEFSGIDPLIPKKTISTTLDGTKDRTRRNHKFIGVFRIISRRKIRRKSAITTLRLKATRIQLNPALTDPPPSEILL